MFGTDRVNTYQGIDMHIYIDMHEYSLCIVLLELDMFKAISTNKFPGSRKHKWKGGELE